MNSTGNNRGKLILVNILDFEDKASLPSRDKQAHDLSASSISLLFQKLNFTVDIKTNIDKNVSMFKLLGFSPYILMFIVTKIIIQSPRTLSDTKFYSGQNPFKQSVEINVINFFFQKNNNQASSFLLIL